MAKQYELHLNEKQLNAMKWALELVFRMHMGQGDMLAESLSAMNYKRNPDDPNHDRKFREHIRRKRNIDLSLELVYSLAVDEWRRSGLEYNFRTEQSAICEDIWQVITHQQWLDNPNREPWSVYSREPLPESKEPLAILKLTKEEGGESCGGASDPV